MFITFNFIVALYVLFCKDLKVNVENSVVRIFMFFFSKTYDFHSTVWAAGAEKYLNNSLSRSLPERGRMKKSYDRRDEK